MHYLSRRVFRERFRLGLRQSYRIAPHHHGTLLDYGELVKLLNECRMNGMPIEEGIPELYTSEEIAECCEGIDAKRVKGFTKRRKNPLPCYKLNQCTLRFTKETFKDWINSK